MSNKFYCGLDFHKNATELCVLDENGKEVEQVRIKSTLLIQFLANRLNYQIGIEASGGVFDVVSKLEASGHKVTIINPVQFRGIGIGGKKTDRKDCQALANALRLGFVPEVHKKTIYSRRIKSLLAARDLVVRTRTQFTNHVRGILREYGVAMPSGITAFWLEVGGKIDSLECETVKTILRGIADQAATLRDQQEQIEITIKTLTRQDERIQRLEEVPGIGNLTAAAFIATFDDVGRFADARHAGSYLGLVPRENSSGNKRRLGSINKAGPELLRRYLIHGARAAMRYSPKSEHKQRVWAAKLEGRAGTNKAVVALAHKNTRICFALLRDGTRYNSPKIVNARLTKTQEKAA